MYVLYLLISVYLRRNGSSETLEKKQKNKSLMPTLHVCFFSFENNATTLAVRNVKIVRLKRGTSVFPLFKIYYKAENTEIMMSLTDIFFISM